MKEDRYKFISFLAMLHITLIICSAILSRKTVNFWFIETTAAALIFPIWFSLCDIIAEIYGYAMSRRIFWCSFFVSIIFGALIYIGVLLPTPENWIHETAYSYIVAYIPRCLASYFVALLLAGFINTYVLTKWKIITRGKLFWMRSFFSSAFGQVLFSIVATAIMFIGLIPLKEVLILTFWSSFFKIIYSAVLVFPANLFVNYLKIKEDSDVFDINTNFNPFIL